MDNPSVFRRRVPQLFAAFAALGGFMLGTVLGWTSPAFRMLEDDLGLSKETISWLGAVMALGAVCSMVVAGFALDRMGRRLPLLCLAPPFVGAWMILAFCRDAALLLAGRFLAGFCAGVFCTTCPVYTGEIAEKEIRGALCVCFQLMVTLGVLYVYVVGKWATLMWLSLLCAVIPILFFVLFFFVPESPFILLFHDKTENATEALRWLRGGANADITGDLAEMTEVFSTVMSIVLVEFAGRRVWMMLSLTGMGTCLVMLGVYYHLKENESPAAASIYWLPLLSMGLYLLASSLGTGPLPWAIIGEIFPGEIKGIASSICGGTNWTVSFIVLKTFRNLRLAIGKAATFWIYACSSYLSVAWVFFFLFETRNKTLDQIQNELTSE